MSALVLSSEPPSGIAVKPKLSKDEPLHLHIGCGPQRMDGLVNCDLYPSSATDVLFNSIKLWPFLDNCVFIINTSHTLEHREDFKTFFRESYRVLREDGNM